MAAPPPFYTGVVRSLPAPVSKIALGLLACLLLGGVIAAVRDKPGELPIYMRAAERLWAEQSIYDPADDPAFSYPPAFALVTLPLVPLNDDCRRAAWWGLNLALLGGVLLAVWAAVRPALLGDGNAGADGKESDDRTTRRRLWGWGGLTTVLAGRFVLSPLAYQSHDLILLALMTAAAVCWTRRRNGLAGTAAGLAAAFKATPLLAAAFFLLRRRRSSLLAMALTIPAATFAADALSSNPDRGPWVKTWAERFVLPVAPGTAPDVENAWERWNPLNQSLAGTIARLTSDPSTDRLERGGAVVTVRRLPAETAQQITLAAAGLVLLWLAWCAWRPREQDRPAAPFQDAAAPPGGLTAGLRCLSELALTLGGMLLLSPMSSTQHFVFLLPGIAVIAARLVLRPRDLLNDLAAVGLFALGTLPAKDLIGDELSEVIRSAGGYTACTLIVLLACGRLLWKDRRARRGSPLP
ncbi:glycosyltransferase 87 family protein [Alienimonas sp. DA493]|uniref:glycosyltransferase 87 family protein n=1 Tax=Alienimonas sp. DA493 TaxID=3373605 RepID=UPI0037545BED